MSERHVGVEIEFAGLGALEAAKVVAGAIGGTAKAEGRHHAVLEGSELGKVRFELDTSLAKPADPEDAIAVALDEAGTRAMAASLLSAVVPVELVTEPITRDAFGALDRAAAALRRAGCEGTEGGFLYAFGLHLNVELVPLEPERAVRIAAAFAFVEPWLRIRLRPDPLRRITPFVDPYPPDYVAMLARAVTDDRLPGLGDFIHLYAAWNPDRNRSLDLWPLLGHLDPEAAEAAHEGPIKNARPAFHYRLPDSRLGERGWSPLMELERWDRIEALADAAPRLKAAAAVALEHHRGGTDVPEMLSGLARVMA